MKVYKLSDGRYRVNKSHHFRDEAEAEAFANGDSPPAPAEPVVEFDLPDERLGSAMWWTELLASLAAAAAVDRSESTLKVGRCVAALAAAAGRHRDQTELEETVEGLKQFREESLQAMRSDRKRPETPRRLSQVEAERLQRR